MPSGECLFIFQQFTFHKGLEFFPQLLHIYLELSKVLFLHNTVSHLISCLFFRLPDSVPLGYASFPHEGFVTPENWLSYKYKNVISYTQMPDGGHFAALGQPKLLAEDLRQFSQKVETFLEEKKE